MSSKFIDDIRYNLLRFISLFHQNFTPAFRIKNDKYNCTKNQIKAIMIIGKSGKISPTVLGKCMDMEKGSVTTLIYSLEELNLVHREDDQEDRRKVLIQLTDEGLKYYLVLKNRFLNQIEERFFNLSKDEIIEFNKSLQFVVEILEKVRDA